MNTASNLVNIIDDLKTQGVTPKVTKLKSAVKKNRRSVWQRQSQHGAGRAMGAVNKSSEGATGATTCGGGAGMNLNKVYGIGASKSQTLRWFRSVMKHKLRQTVRLQHLTVSLLDTLGCTVLGD